MCDLVDRDAVLALAKDICVPCKDGTEYRHRSIDPTAVMELPAARESYEWCTRGKYPCKEYDYENHCCHRWTSFIRQTVEDLKIVHCNECIYSESVDDKQDGYRCLNAMHAYRSAIWFGGDYCSYGERK